MHKIQAAITLFLLCSGIASSGQSFSASEWDRISLGILNMRSENLKLKAEAAIDSTTIQELTRAYYYKDSAFVKCKEAVQESTRIAQDNHALYLIREQEVKDAKKEIRKQKRLKWLSLGLGIFGLLAAAL